MVRVGGLQLQKAAGAASTDASGMTVAAQLDSIRQRTAAMVQAQYDCFHKDLEPVCMPRHLARAIADASVKHREAAESIFEEEVFSVLSPMAIEEDGEFPLLVNHAMYVCVQVAAPKQDPAYRFAIIPLGKILSRIITLPSEKGFSYAMLEDIVATFAGRFFPNEKVMTAVPFRITRNADGALQEDSAADLMSDMKELLQQRRTASCVRLET